MSYPKALRRSYCFVVTDAPVEYDYSDTINLGAWLASSSMQIDLQQIVHDPVRGHPELRTVLRSENVRIVMIPEEKTWYQSGRYLSRMHLSHVVTEEV